MDQNNPTNEEELLDYDDDEQQPIQKEQEVEKQVDETKKGGYVSIHSSGFRDFLLKPELLRAITDCGFEHVSTKRMLSWSLNFVQNLEPT